jgi:hypothetical protein
LWRAKIKQLASFLEIDQEVDITICRSLVARY